MSARTLFPTRPGSCLPTARGLASGLQTASRSSTCSACAKHLWTTKHVQAGGAWEFVRWGRLRFVSASGFGFRHVGRAICSSRSDRAVLVSCWRTRRLSGNVGHGCMEGGMDGRADVRLGQCSLF